MEKRDKEKTLLPTTNEKVRLDSTFYAKYRGFALFLICCALLISAFAISSVWMQGGKNQWLDSSVVTEDEKDHNTDAARDPVDTDGDRNGDDVQIPAQATPIVARDISYISLGDGYIHNETSYIPDLEKSFLKDVAFRNGETPAVLIVHTHTSEGYLPSGTAYITEPLGALTYTEDPSANVIAVGKALAQTLQKKGITVYHCTVMHDAAGLKGAYERSSETVKKYLDEYPEIGLVIDLHRDAVINAEGEAIDAVTEINGKKVAQVMAVVGSEGNGTVYENWENNLSLALQLRSVLNRHGNLCRPVSIRNASFYQELAPCALLLEIGTAAGTLDAAIAAAEFVGEAIAELLYC